MERFQCPVVSLHCRGVLLVGLVLFPYGPSIAHIVNDVLLLLFELSLCLCHLFRCQDFLSLRQVIIPRHTIQPRLQLVITQARRPLAYHSPGKTLCRRQKRLCRLRRRSVINRKVAPCNARHCPRQPFSRPLLFYRLNKRLHR